LLHLYRHSSDGLRAECGVAENEVASHYGSTELGRELLSALDRAFGDSLDAAALRSVDQFHLGGYLATEALLDRLELRADAEVLDVGCGIGGVAREIASRFSCSVTAIDLTPSFVEAARQLSDRVGVDPEIEFETGDALEMPYEDGRFDAVVVVHVGMNIRDKASLIAELHRVAKPGATVVIYDIVRLTTAPLGYPLPWATSESMDFVEPQDAYIEALSRSGLVLASSIDRSELVFDAIERMAANPAPVNLANLMGSAWPTMFGNLVAALRDRTLAPVEMAVLT
jgi:ubiquinone/menaquinone biosynthesis C-methylase UbiE